jgi:hypothetical protein
MGRGQNFLKTLLVWAYQGKMTCECALRSSMMLECTLRAPGVLEISCTHRLIPASDGLETSKEEGECSMLGKGA